MRVWGESSDGRARHFKHIGDMGHGEGSGGSEACESVAESDKHIKWKNLAAERLMDEFGDNVAECRVEMELRAPESDKDRRVGDAVLVFDEFDEQLGRGIVVEVQHKNHSKDIGETTADYISQDFSVVWTYESDYSKDHCRLAEVDFRQRAFEEAWPEYTPSNDRWWSTEHNFKSQQKKWRSAFESGLAESGAPATLPQEWCDEQAREIWESQYWYSLFGAQDPLGNYDSERYIREVQESLSDGPAAEVKLPKEWCDDAAIRLWNETDWDRLFPTPKSERIDDYTSVEYQSEVYIEEVRGSLNDPMMRVNMWDIYPEESVKAWYNTGLRKRENTKEWIPAPEKWHGVSDPEFDYSTPKVEIKLPPEFFEAKSEELELHWRYGAGKLEVDLAKQMKENNADRPCSNCSGSADYYLLKSGVLSEYRCLDCALAIVRSANELSASDESPKAKT